MDTMLNDGHLVNMIHGHMLLIQVHKMTIPLIIVVLSKFYAF